MVAIEHVPSFTNGTPIFTSTNLVKVLTGAAIANIRPKDGVIKLRTFCGEIIIKPIHSIIPNTRCTWHITLCYSINIIVCYRTVIDLRFRAQEHSCSQAVSSVAEILNDKGINHLATVTSDTRASHSQFFLLKDSTFVISNDTVFKRCTTTYINTCSSFLQVCTKFVH